VSSRVCEACSGSLAAIEARALLTASGAKVAAASNEPDRSGDRRKLLALEAYAITGE